MVTSRISYSLQCELGHAKERIIPIQHEVSRLHVDSKHDGNMPTLYVAMATWIPKCNMYNDVSDTDEETIDLRHEEEAVHGDVTSIQNNETSDKDMQEIQETNQDNLKLTKNDENPNSPQQSTTTSATANQKRLDSAKKKEIKAKEKEERERKKLEEKQKREEEKKMKEEQKRKEKEEKEEQRRKEKEEKEAQKKHEKEEKELQRRKEKEEREEQKRKEREGKEFKRKEREEKHQKKQETLKKEQQFFAKFFVYKKNTNSNEAQKSENQKNAFKNFEIKPNMRLAPQQRRLLTDEQKQQLEVELQNQSTDLPSVGEWAEARTSSATWPRQDDQPQIPGNDDIIIVDDGDNETSKNRESIISEYVYEEEFEENYPNRDSSDKTVSEEEIGEHVVQKRQVGKMRAKFFKFHENRRPPYFGTWRKRSTYVKSRRPFARDLHYFNYDVDSDSDWEEDDPGESLRGSDDEDKDNDPDDYEVDYELIVPHGYLSDDENVGDEDGPASPGLLSPGTQRNAKLKLLECEFIAERRHDDNRIVSRKLGPVWQRANTPHENTQLDAFLCQWQMIARGRIRISPTHHVQEREHRVATPARKQLVTELVPEFLRLVHGNTHSRVLLVHEFHAYLTARHPDSVVSRASLNALLKQIARWQKCPVKGPMFGKTCWFVGQEVREKHDVHLTLPNSWSHSELSPRNAPV